MTRTSVLTILAATVVLVASVGYGVADRAMPLEKSAANQQTQIPADTGLSNVPGSIGKAVLAGPPYVREYSNSGCLGMTDMDWEPCVDDDVVQLTVAGNTLHVLHLNTTYNCCLDAIPVTLSIDEDVIRMTETEVVAEPCDCMCCYNVDSAVADLPAGEYLVEYCWFDYETGGDRCHTETIVIGPRIGTYSNSGCLAGALDDEWPMCVEDDEIILTVADGTLHTLHTNASYNCCLDDIIVTLSVEDSLIQLTETEYAPEPCWCICCYEVEATVLDLPPGEYTVEYCWYDFELSDRCHVEQIVIP